MINNNLLRNYSRVIFKPFLRPIPDDQNFYKDCLNLFAGYPLKINSVSIDKYKNSLLRENTRKYLCNGDKEPDNFIFVEKHTAHMLQKPT